MLVAAVVSNTRSAPCAAAGSTRPQAGAEQASACAERPAPEIGERQRRSVAVGDAQIERRQVRGHHEPAGSVSRKVTSNAPSGPLPRFSTTIAKVTVSPASSADTLLLIGGWPGPST